MHFLLQHHLDQVMISSSTIWLTLQTRKQYLQNLHAHYQRKKSWLPGSSSATAPVWALGIQATCAMQQMVAQLLQTVSCETFEPLETLRISAEHRCHWHIMKCAYCSIEIVCHDVGFYHPLTISAGTLHIFPAMGSTLGLGLGDRQTPCPQVQWSLTAGDTWWYRKPMLILIYIILYVSYNIQT